MTQNIRIATYNIRNTMDRYSERKEILKQTLQSQKSDIMGLQEVAFNGQNEQLTHLLTEENTLNKIYKNYNAQMQFSWQSQLTGEISKECNLDGNSIITSKQFEQNNQVLETKQINLSLFRVAQFLKVQLQNKQILYIVNTHLHHVIPDTQVRLHQAQDIIQWLKLEIQDYENQNIIILGDFNANPQEPMYNLFENNNYISTYKQIHTQEPIITFPTGLKAPNMDMDPPNCLDYIWYKGKQIKPLDCLIFGDKCLQQDDTIYPSDHMGLISNFECSNN